MSGTAAPPVRARQHDACTITCAEFGCTVRSAAPIIDLCRRLRSQSVCDDLRRPLHVFRGEALAVIVRSIEETAALRVMIA
jgi:hypothetical protein